MTELEELVDYFHNLIKNITIDITTERDRLKRNIYIYRERESARQKRKREAYWISRADKSYIRSLDSKEKQDT